MGCWDRGPSWGPWPVPRRDLHRGLEEGGACPAEMGQSAPQNLGYFYQGWTGPRRRAVVLCRLQVMAFELSRIERHDLESAWDEGRERWANLVGALFLFSWLHVMTRLDGDGSLVHSSCNGTTRHLRARRPMFNDRFPR